MCESRGYYVGQLHSFVLDWDDGDISCFRVNYGPIGVTASSWIVPETIIEVEDVHGD